MKTTIRLAKPVPVVFEHRGRSRTEFIGTVTFSSHYGEPELVPSEELIDRVWAMIEQDGRYRSDLCSLALDQGLMEAYIDAGFRATAHIDFEIRHHEAGDVPMLDIAPLEARRFTLNDIYRGTPLYNAEPAA